MTDVLTLTFDVACPQGHAFDTWTGRLSTWWPRDQTGSGEDTTELVLAPGVG